MKTFTWTIFIGGDRVDWFLTELESKTKIRHHIIIPGDFGQLFCTTDRNFIINIVSVDDVMGVYSIIITKSCGMSNRTIFTNELVHKKSVINTIIYVLEDYKPNWRDILHYILSYGGFLFILLAPIIILLLAFLNPTLIN